MTDQPDITAAHQQRETESFEYNFPAHEPRARDPHYAVFNATAARLRKLGSLKCWIGNADCQGGIELHHSTVEFSLANIVDEAHFAQLYPDFHVADDATFLAWVEGEGNLTPLCVMHHRGLLGIHTIHYPAWLVQRFMKNGIAPPERKIAPADVTVTVTPGSTVVVTPPTQGA